MGQPERAGEPRREQLKIPRTDLVCEIVQYEGKSPRVNGLKSLLKAGARIPDEHVIRDTIFRLWKEHDRQIPEEARQVLIETYERLQEEHPGKGVHIGRAFYVPDVDEPQGPRTADIQNAEDFLREVEGFYKYIVDEQPEYDREGAEIALVTHDFMSSVNPPLKEKPLRPYSGGAAILRHDGVIEIEAVFGQDEGIQSSPSDIYELRSKNDGFSVNWTIAKKETALIPKKGKYQKINLHPSVHKKRALYPGQIIEIAGVIFRLSQQATEEGGERKLFRAEFQMTEHGPTFRECVEFPYVEEVARDIDITSKVAIIKDQNDAGIEKLLKPHAGGQLIAYIHPDLFEKRNLDAIAFLGNQASKFNVDLVVLAYGHFGGTAHRVKNLKEKGIEIKFIGGEVVEDGELMHVYTRNKEVYIEKNPTKKLGELPISLSRDGGKVVGLERMKEFGFLIPEGFKINVEVYKKHLVDAQINREDLVRVAALYKEGKKGDVDTLLEQMRGKIMETPLSDVYLTHIMEAAGNLGKEISLRSSANCEDQTGTSFAGYFTSKTKTPNRRSDIEESIKKVFASVSDYLVVAGAESGNIPFEDIQMGILAHERVNAEKQGVMYTSESGKLILEVGIDKDVVKMDAKQHIEFDLESKKIVLSEGEKLMGDEEAKKLFNLGVNIEKKFKSPQDVEWAITPDNSVVFLQSRDL